MNTNKKGFTLIELLVVIVIIGILATISVATFGGYFARARDSERQAVVQNISTIIKVQNATGDAPDYALVDVAALDAALASQGYTKALGDGAFNYLYAASAGEFVVAVCSEEAPGTVFTAGTQYGGTAAANICANPVVALTALSITATGNFTPTVQFVW